MKPSRELPVGTPVPGVEIIADFIDAIGSASFFLDFGRAIGRMAPFDSLLFFLYRPDAAPVLVSSSTVSDEFQRGLDNYLDHTYLLNPVYQAFKTGVSSAVYRMSDLMPDGYGDLIGAVEFEVKIDTRETIGFLTPGWPKRTEELLLLINLPDGSMVEASILRKREVGFSQAEFYGLSQVFPAAIAVFHKHWELVNQDFSTHVGRPSLDSSFDEFGAEVLTEREKEVVKLVLTGHSSESISLRLGISVATIKTHRRNIYAKLEIGSQAELFFRFIDFLTKRSPF